MFGLLVVPFDSVSSFYANHAFFSTMTASEIVRPKALRTFSDSISFSGTTKQQVDYMAFPGMYPHAAGLIASHGPYNSVKDIYGVRRDGFVVVGAPSIMCMPWPMLSPAFSLLICWL